MSTQTRTIRIPPDAVPYEDVYNNPRRGLSVIVNSDTFVCPVCMHSTKRQVHTFTHCKSSDSADRLAQAPSNILTEMLSTQCCGNTYYRQM